MTNLNLIELFKKIIIDEDSFDSLKEYSRSRNMRIPDHANLEDKLFNTLKNFNEEVSKKIEDPEDPWFGDPVPPEMKKPVTQENFKRAEDAIFLSSSNIPPIYTDFIYKYHVYEDASKKENFINILKESLSLIIKSYEIMGQESRYIDNDFNIIFNNVTGGVSRRIENRIEEVYALDPAVIFTGPEREVYDILNKYGLL